MTAHRRRRNPSHRRRHHRRRNPVRASLFTEGTKLAISGALIGFTQPSGGRETIKDAPDWYAYKVEDAYGRHYCVIKKGEPGNSPLNRRFSNKKDALEYFSKKTAKQNGKRKRNLDHRDSSHQVKVHQRWRAGGLSQWQRAHHAGQSDLFAHGIKAKPKRNAAGYKIGEQVYMAYGVPVAGLLFGQSVAIVEKKSGRYKVQSSTGAGWVNVDAVVKRKPNPKRKGKRNQSAESIRKDFAGSVSGSRDLYFPQGTPQGLAKLGKLVSIKTEEGTLKPVSGTAWLCADTKGHLHIGTTQNKPLWDGQAHSFGAVKEVEYEASKPHLGFPNPIVFYHKLGEETGRKPTLHADGKGGLKFKGGAYKITSRGIEN